MKFLRGALIAAFVMFAMVTGVSAGSGPGICHAAGNSGKWEYVPAASAGVIYGHLGSDHQNGRDIIPTFVFEGETYSQNWDDYGKSIYNNGCKIPADPTPTDEVTAEPTDVPTEAPTEAPTQEPVSTPTTEPTVVPTNEPTEAPTEAPTQEPTVVPTTVPTENPTEVVSTPTEVATPSASPTVPVVDGLPETGTGFAEGKTYAIVSILVGAIVGGIVTYRMTED